MTGWTIENLKELMDAKISALQEIADLKVIHLYELREADQRALDLVAKNNQQHFGHLNENAARTIEEQSHFISMEAFTPFKEFVYKSLNQGEGKERSVGMVGSSVLGFLVGLASLSAIAAFIHQHIL